MVLTDIRSTALYMTSQSYVNVQVLYSNKRQELDCKRSQQVSLWRLKCKMEQHLSQSKLVATKLLCANRLIKPKTALCSIMYKTTSIKGWWYLFASICIYSFNELRYLLKTSSSCDIKAQALTVKYLIYKHCCICLNVVIIVILLCNYWFCCYLWK